MDSNNIRYPKSNSYRHVVENLVKNNKEKAAVRVPSSVATELPTLCSPHSPLPGDLVIRHLLDDGGRLTKIKRGDELHYHLKVPDGRQIILERTDDSLVLLMTDKHGKPIHSMACEL